MPAPNPPAMEFLLSRRSRPAKTLRAPYPAREDLTPILTAALRSPDHGKLEPWRLIVLEKPALRRLSELAETRGQSLGLDPDQTEKGVAQFRDSGLAIAVIFSPKDSPKIPQIEQIYSTGAVCLAALNAALASGWGANWLSGWPSHDADFGTVGLGLSAIESIAGFIRLGTEAAAPPERPRPDIHSTVTWVSE